MSGSRASRVRKQILELEHELLEIQNECPHNNTTKKYGANTGNYDPSADVYWIDWHCEECGKFWRTPQ